MFRRKPYVPTGRIGYLKYDAEGYGRWSGIEGEITVRVEETAQEGRYSHLKILNVTGGEPRIRRAAWDQVERFLPTEEIEWVK